MSPTVLEQFRLSNRRALITGSSKGLGKVFATALAQAGADVALVARNVAECRAAAAEVATVTGRRAVAIAADVTKADHVDGMIAEAEAAIGPIDILINNAGVNIRGP